MDKAVFINELRNIFLELNQKEKRYSKVWLGEPDFGGLYYSGKYVLNLKMAHQIDRYKPELRFIHDLLDEKLGKAQDPYIYHLYLYNENEYANLDRDDIVIYNDEVATQAA